MARIRIYTNSIGGTILNLFGYFSFLLGIVVLVDGEILFGVIFILIGIGLMIAAATVAEGSVGKSRTDNFKAFKETVEREDMTRAIAASVPFAVEMYQKFPDPRTLSYIAGLNPEAERYIRYMAAEKGKEKYQNQQQR